MPPKARDPNGSRVSTRSSFPSSLFLWTTWANSAAGSRSLRPEKAAGRKYELPTEAQWEYACRAGTTTDFSFGDDEYDLCEHAWIRLNSGGRTHRVGEKLPNPFGLYDMLGNVYEWCADGYTQDWYSRSPVDDPIAPSSFERRANRGGCWGWAPVLCRSAVYGQLPRESRKPGGGFRVVLLVTEVPREKAAANAAGSR